MTTVHPAGVRTPMWTGTDFWTASLKQRGGDLEATWSELAATTPMQRFAEPEEAARTRRFLASDAASHITGTELLVDGGYAA